MVAKNWATKKVGRLYVIEKTDKRSSNGSVIWKCKCECGTILEVSTKDFGIDKKRGVPRVQSCGCLNDETRRDKAKEPIPQDDSFIEVLEEIGYTTQRKLEYRCKCKKCDSEIILNKKAIRRRKQCDSCNRREMKNSAFKRIGNKSQSWQGYKNIPKSIFTYIKAGAKKRNKDFDITIEYMNELWEKQNGICALSGIQLNISEKVTDRTNTTASLDRIDSSKGYVEGNVQWVHKDINRIKWGLTNEKFIDYCKRVANVHT